MWGLFNSPRNKSSALFSDIKPSLIFYLPLRALFPSNSHYFQFSSALPKVSRHDSRILPSETEQDPRVLPDEPEQDHGILPDETEQDPRILPDEPQQDPRILKNLEDSPGMFFK